MLYDKINKTMLEAMKSKDKDTLSTIRLLKSAIDLYKINNKLTEITDEVVIEVASKQVKQHRESIEEFRNAGRDDLADHLENEIKPEGKKDMGKIMKEANIRLKGKADFKLVSTIVNAKLGM